MRLQASSLSPGKFRAHCKIFLKVLRGVLPNLRALNLPIQCPGIAMNSRLIFHLPDVKSRNSVNSAEARRSVKLLSINLLILSKLFK